MFLSKRPATAVFLAFAGILSFASEAFSQATDTGTLSVNASVTESCTVNGGTLNFGAYESGQAGTIAAVGTISYSNCSRNTVNVALDGGQANSEIPRLMSDGNGNNLQYHIFQDANRTIFWGTGTDSQDLAVDASGSGSWQLYGRIIREQSVPAGTYTDSVNITVTF